MSTFFFNLANFHLTKSNSTEEQQQRHEGQQLADESR
jgi:hypothetical protein